MRAAVLLLLILSSGCVSVLVRHGAVRNDGVEVIEKPNGAERGRVRYRKAGGGGVDPTLNRSDAEDEMALACPTGKYIIDSESDEARAAGFVVATWRVISFHCMAN